MVVPEFQKKTLKTVEYIARKIDKDLIQEYEPKRWSLQHTGASGTPEEHPDSDIDINFSVDKETLEKYEVDVIGPYCAKLQLEAKRMMGGRDVTIWLQEIEDFDHAHNYRIYSRNAAMYGETDKERHMGTSDLPAPITNKLVLTQWAMKERNYPDATFLGGSENILEKVRKDPTLLEPVRWEGYEMSVRAMRDLVKALSELDTAKTSKAILRMAHALHVSLGRRFLHNYEEVVDACHGMLAEYEDYENLVTDAGEKRRTLKEDGITVDYDFNDEHFKKTLLDFATLCRAETKEVARREGYFRMPERVACLDFYITSSTAPVAREIISGASVAKEFSGLLAGEVVDLLLRYNRMIYDDARTPYVGKRSAAPVSWIERLNKVGVAPKLNPDEIDELKGRLGEIEVSEPGLQGKIFLVTDKKAEAARKLDEAIEAATTGETDKYFFSYTMPNEQILAELYVCRADATDNDEEAAEFYEKALREDVLQPYCWEKLANVRSLANYKTVARMIGESMQAGQPWSTYLTLHFIPDILGEKADDVWQTAYKKRLERFKKHVERLEKVAKEMKSKSPDELGSEHYDKTAEIARKYRDEILESRATAARGLLGFLEESSPIFGVVLDQFVNYDIESRRYAERAEMMRRSVLRTGRAVKRKIIRKAASGKIDDLQKAKNMARKEGFERLVEKYRLRMEEAEDR